MGLDEQDHVVSDGYYGYTYEDKIDQFVAKYELTDQQKTMMNVYRAQAKSIDQALDRCAAKADEIKQTEKPVYVS
jgi:K+/H+ antiporter YhaU regulatory subunit KhtT